MSDTKSIIKHLQQLVSFYPATSEQQNVLELLKYCKQQLEQTGSFKDLEIVCNNDHYSLVASTTSTTTPILLCQAHVDVVPADPADRLIRQEGDTLRGRGVYDMLFGTACYLHFVQKHAEKLDSLNLGIMLTGDEEIGGFYGAQALLDEGYGADVCILPDAGHGFGDVNQSAKGVYNFDITVNGKAHHGSRPWEGDGAANKLVALLTDLDAAFDTSDHDNSTMTITQLHGGDSVNKGPAQASAHIDIRYKDKPDLHRIQQVVKRLCRTHSAEVSNLLIGDDYQLDLKNSHVTSFVELYESHVGRPLTFGKAHGSSDARFFASKNIPVIMFRPDGGGAHSDNEHLSVSSLQKFYSVLEKYIFKTAAIQ